MEPTGRLGIQPLDGPVADERLAALSTDARYASIHAALPDGAVLSGGWTVAAVSTWLPGLHWVGWLVAHVPAAGPALDWLYDSLSPHRGRLSRFVPDLPPVERPGAP